ncbi:MAG: class I SAM-dependent methyltransferase [Candidatus Andersenbacteria bacterium]
MDTRSYWKHKLSEYANEVWSNKPSIFAKQTLSYFPTKGTLLELAGGQGQDSVFFATQGYTVTYSDFVEDVVRNVEKNTDPGLDVWFQVIDLSKPLPFKNASFDVVYSHLGLHYFDNVNTKKVFGEIHRVLKTDGMLATILNTINDPEIKKSNYQEIEPYFFLNPRSGIKKSYFSQEYLSALVKGLFEPVLLDSAGETYKDETKSLIRFVGKPLNK